MKFIDNLIGKSEERNQSWWGKEIRSMINASAERAGMNIKPGVRIIADLSELIDYNEEGADLDKDSGEWIIC